VVVVVQGDCWICMELMDICLDQFYRFVHGGLCQRIPENILGRITLAVSSISLTVVTRYLVCAILSCSLPFLWYIVYILFHSLRPTLEIVACHCLGSADATTLQVPLTRRATVRDRAFPVATAWAWKSLPPETQACSSLVTFRKESKSNLFCQSYGWLALSVWTVGRRLRWTVQ